VWPGIRRHGQSGPPGGSQRGAARRRGVRLGAQFQKEARLQAALHHPQIIAIYSLEEDADTRELYLVCEYANGGSLAEHLAAGRVPEAQAILIGRDICAALDATWQQLIVHRDIKPSNILLIKDAGGTIVGAKLSDFGIAQDQKQRRTTLMPGMGHPGTPLYMPPEQGSIANVLDVRSDLYALGVTLWEMQTGRDLKLLPSAHDAEDLQAQHAPISPGMAAVIWRAAQPDREQRYASPAEMANELAAVRDGRWAPARDTIILPRRRQALAARPATADLPRQRWRPSALLAGLLAIAAVLVVLIPISMSSGAAEAPIARIDKPLAEAIVAAKPDQLSPACLKQQIASADTAPIVVGAPVQAVSGAREFAKGGELLTRWDAETQATHVAFSPDGQIYATALDDGTIKLWPVGRGKPLRTLCLPADGSPSVVGLGFLDDGNTIAAASAGGHILFWRIDDGKLVRQIDLDAKKILSLAFAPNGKLFAANVADNAISVKIFPIDSAEPLQTIQWNTTSLAGLLFSPDSQIIVMSDASGSVSAARLKNGQDYMPLNGIGGLVAGEPPRLAFSPDGATLAIGMAGGYVQLRDADGNLTGVLDKQGKVSFPPYPVPDDKAIEAVPVAAQPAFSPDRTVLAVAQPDGTIDLWNISDGARIRTLEGGPTKGHASIMFAPDGRSLLVAWEAGAVELWGLPPT
jgi:WD40 repeat protein